MQPSERDAVLRRVAAALTTVLHPTTGDDVVSSGRSIPAPTGIWGDAEPVVDPVLDEMFLGTTTVEEALARAQELATATLEDDPGEGGRGTPR